MLAVCRKSEASDQLEFIQWSSKNTHIAKGVTPMISIAKDPHGPKSEAAWAAETGCSQQ